MKTLGVFNIKGGVGKTATAVNIAYLAAREGFKVLFWDLDPQGSSTYYFRVKPRIKGGTRGLVEKKHELSQLIKGTDFDNLDLLPADFSYRMLDIQLVEKKLTTLFKILKPVTDDYDLLVLDCPPSISALSEHIFSIVDGLLVPIIPTSLSLRTYEQLMSFRDKKGYDSANVWPFFSMVDRRKKLHRDIIEHAAEEYPEFLNSYIPYSSIVEQMGLKRAPVHSFAPSSLPAQMYQSLWEDTKFRLQMS